jgi:hypothetical protein
MYKLGNKVKFQKSLILSKLCKCGDFDKKETLKFANENGLYYEEDDDIYINGLTVLSRWKVRKFENIQEGMICGVRTVDLSGQWDREYGYIYGQRKKVYLIATNLRGFYVVPEEFISS